MIKGSMMYDQYGRKRKVKKLYTKAKQPDFVAQSKKTMKPTVEIPSMPVGEYKTPADKSFQKEVSKQYTVSIAYNKGAYQVIPNKEVKYIGK